MPIIRVSLEGDNAWKDIAALYESQDPRLIDAMGGDTVWHFSLLKGGMTSGKYSVALRLDLADGRVVTTQTSWDAFNAAVKALSAKVELG